MNERILKTLEFEQVKTMIQQHLTTEQGEEEIRQLTPSNDEDTIQAWLDETEDGMKVQRLRGGLPIPKLNNIKPHMKRIEIGANLNGLELAEVSRVLSTTSELVRFIEDLKDSELEFQRLYFWEEQLTTLPELSGKLRRSVEEDGRVRDEASTELRTIRSQIRRSEQTIREQLDGLIRGKNAKYLSDSLITMRNDRYVIPVKQEYRGIFGGVVHDQSASGQTLFMEPKQIVELNNRLRQQQIAERTEIERILAELSAELVAPRKDILHNAYVLGRFDLMNAKARFAKNLKAVVPSINQDNHVYFKQARHPLLDQDKAVANDLMIGQDFQAVVITGPNTGGKTISLKTLGLLQLMGQAGFPLPVGEESEMGIFDEVFADIGDEQSIEQSLSTFSSHMTNIVSILDKIDEHSLVLFDELGAGTDPQEGAALAIAILDAVGAKSSYIMATTHYPELKIYGYNRPNTINASMEFDVDTLSPTYRLLIGVPGRSNAFEISRRLGLDSTVIDSAKQIIDEESQDLNDMISALENQRKATETEYLEIRHYVDESEKLYRDLKNAYSYFFDEREKEMEKARKEANKIIGEAEENAEKIIKDIRQMQLEGQGSIKEHQLIDARSQLADLKQDEQLKKNKVLQKAKAKKQFKPNDEVIVETYGQRGTLIQKVGNNDWQVQLGILKMTVSEEDMTLTTPIEEPKQQVITGIQRGAGAQVKPELDLRGKRYEEALAEVDHYIDAALLANFAQVRIIHGKGTGALRKGITDYLKNHRNVKSFEFAPANQGGSGATVVTFK